MNVQLTPEILKSCYELLRQTQPFCRWKLPVGDAVKFRIAKDLRGDYAQYSWDGEQHEITMSSGAIGHLNTLIEKMAHEMIHMHLEERGLESRTGNEDTHNIPFRNFAARVCKIHGFDPKAFY